MNTRHTSTFIALALTVTLFLLACSLVTVAPATSKPVLSVTSPPTVAPTTTQPALATGCIEPIVEFNAKKTSIAAGEVTALYWSVLNATSITLSGGEFSNKTESPQGYEEITPPTTTSYTLRTESCAGPREARITITVAPTTVVSTPQTASTLQVQILRPISGAPLRLLTNTLSAPIKVQITASGRAFLGLKITLLVDSTAMDQEEMKLAEESDYDKPLVTLVRTLTWKEPKSGKHQLVVTAVDLNNNRASTQVDIDVETVVWATAADPNAGTVVRTGGIFRVETPNLVINYPDFIDPNEARQYADTLQNAYDAYLAIFNFGKEGPHGGQKTTIDFFTHCGGASAGENSIGMCKEFVESIPAGESHPSVYFHEMVHIFQNGQERAGRYYVYNGDLVSAMNEAFAEYFLCHPDILKYWTDHGASDYCEGWRTGSRFKNPEETLAYYESQNIDPYSLDWRGYVPEPGQPRAKFYFTQMLFRVSDQCGWGVWQNFFALTKEAGTGNAAKEAFENKEKLVIGKVPDMRQPLLKQAFAEFVTSLSKACGKDLFPMFRGWRFDL